MNNQTTTAEHVRLTRRDLIAAILLLLPILVFTWKLIFTQLILPRGDMFLYFYPYWDYRNEIMRSGALPLWNPYLFMGAPFLANSQTGVLYPLNWLLIPFQAPTAINISVVLHLYIASIGTYLFSRRSMNLSIPASALAAVIFSLGGYLSAQIEHINQIQGLAWLPFLFWLWHESLAGHRKAALWLGLVFAFQLLAGHTQTAFISGFGLGCWALWNTYIQFRKSRKLSRRDLLPLTLIALAVIIALFLSAVQLLPTIELAQLSNRSGGLPFLEAVSFSLRPQIIGRAFLPGYHHTPLFTEYVAYIGTATLMLTVFGFIQRRKSAQVLGLGLIAVLGVFLALGSYNPVYWLLVKFAPGFDLFRAPARWLILFAFSGSLLTGLGFDALALNNHRIKNLILPLLAVLILIALSFLSPLSADAVPGAEAPALREIILWTAFAAAFTTLAVAMPTKKLMPVLLFALILTELFLASRSLPYNDLSSPEAWYSQRPAVSTLLAANAEQTPPPRMLSLSDIYYDPGDLAEITAIYSQFLTDDALFDYIVDIKHKEVLSPNLPLAWRIPTVDGFDGGILPTRDYIRFTSLTLPPDKVAVDGRLREYLDTVPPLDWLRIANVGWIITDKVADRWIDGVYYDTQFPALIDMNAQPHISAYPQRSLQSTAVGILAESLNDQPPAPGTILANITIIAETHRDSFSQPLVADENLIDNQAIVSFDTPFTADFIIVESVSEDHPLRIDGVSLIDQRTDAFIPTTLSQSGELQLSYAADVKIYDFNGTLPRAYLVCDPLLVNSQDEAFASLAENPAQTVITSPIPLEQLSCAPDNPGTAQVTSYEPEEVVIHIDVESGAGAYLILSDAFYPGWLVEIDGKPAEMLQANSMFRAVAVPSGEHEVIFRFHSRALTIGSAISITTLVFLVIGLLWKGHFRLPGTKARSEVD